MKKMDNVSITRFETECFYIDIIDNGDKFEAWLTYKTDGVSNLMFGMYKDNEIDFDLFCEIVEANLDEYRYEYYRSESGLDDEEDED